ncbi:CoA transferase [Streptomyces sp. NPDC005805]|uniref:CoA transferase n=1 Tax=Streptomyces sp. NPDC005805 TaxID=3157068 RepID=UPI0033C93613
MNEDRPAQGTAPVDGVAEVWAALGGSPGPPEGLVVTGRAGLPGRLPAQALARSCVAVCSLAAAELSALRTGGPVPTVRVDDDAVATAFLGDRLVRVDGRTPTTFAPLSRFWRTADGWVRTHANYPHHRARLLAALRLPADADPDALAAALAGRRAAEVEETVYAAGGLAVAVRTPGQWAAHPQGAAAAAHPLPALRPVGAESAPRATAPAPAALPCAGLRVLDLTRVLAGPVATRTLALLGADVLRLDPPALPEAQDAHDDTGLGKRSALLDLARPADRAVFEELLSSADVVVTGYRPGALDRFGLSPEALAARRPGLVVGRLSAWGRTGPWAGRRGFDSLVQAASGIAVTEGSGPDSPGALPAQALDHGTGYLLAAGVLRALTDQHRRGGARVVDVALAGTAAWLTGGAYRRTPDRPDCPAPGEAFEPEERLTETDTPRGRLRHALPAVAYDGGPAGWASPSGLLGADPPAWLG